MKYTYTYEQLNQSSVTGISALFQNYEWAEARGGVDQENYHTVDSGIVDADTPEDACEKLYQMYRFERPTGYEGRKMGVSDIVNLWDNSVEPPVKTSWFCDSVGFKQLKKKSGPGLEGRKELYHG